jgi:ribonuclease HI
MELMAVIFALKSVKQPIDSLTIYSDSMYVIGCATLGWKRKKNVLLWKLFDEVYENAKKLASEINFVHVKGHNGNRYNEMVDKLAVQATQ